MSRSDVEAPPQVVDAEESLLGALLYAGALGPAASEKVVRRISGLRAADFYLERHGTIFRACLAVVGRGEPSDVLVVINELRQMRKLEEIGGELKIKELAHVSATSANAEHFARLIGEAAVNRQLIRKLGPLVDAARSNVLDPAGAKAALTDAQSLVAGERVRDVRHRVHNFVDLVAQYDAERSGDGFQPVLLGIGSIDADVRGVGLGQVCGLAGRTAVGKTSLEVSIIENISAREDVGILICSLEQPGVEWAEKALAAHADVPPEQVEMWARRGMLAQHVGGFLDRMQRVVLVDDGVSLEELPAVIAAANDRLYVPVRVVVIDYLGLLEVSGEKAYERASKLGKGLKMLAKAENVAVIVAMQLSRAAGDGSTPVTLDMLRDSGVLEESLDFLVGCWRPGLASNLTPPEMVSLKHVLSCRILKNRKGNAGRTVELRFRESRRLVEDAPVPAIGAAA